MISWKNGAELIYNRKDFGMGKGERSLAAMALGLKVTPENIEEVIKEIDSKKMIMGSVSTFDLDVKESVGDLPIGHYEVKEPDANNKVKMSSDGMAHSTKHMPWFRELNGAISAGIDGFDDRLQELFDPIKYVWAKQFVRYDVKMIDRMQISYGRIFSSKKQAVGVIQIAEMMKKVREHVLKGVKIPTFTLTDEGGEKNSVSPYTYVKIMKLMGVCDSWITDRIKKRGVTEEQARALQYLTHPAFYEPDLVREMYNKMLQPSECLDVDYFAAVWPHGVEIVKKDDFDVRLIPSDLVQGGRPQYEYVTEAYLSGDVASPESEEQCSPDPSTEQLHQEIQSTSSAI